MNNDPAKDAIVDLVEDDAFYAYRKHKAETEKATLAIYIFATLSLLMYVIFLVVNYQSFDWFLFLINILIIIICFCLAIVSKNQSYIAIICTAAIVGIVMIADLILTAQLSIKGLVVKLALVIYICMKLDAAKNVQAYDKNNLNKAG